MCNYSKGVREEGREEGRRDSIGSFIKAMLNLNISRENIIGQLIASFDMTRSDAEKCFVDYQSAHK